MRAVSVVPLFLVGCVGLGGFGSTNVSVGFPSAEGFRPGDPVLYKEQSIGEVTRVAVEQARTVVYLRITAREPTLRASAIFHLQQPSFFGGGQRAVVLDNPGEGTVLKSGTELRGYTSAEMAVEAVKKAARSVYDSARQVIADAADDVHTEEGQAFLNDLRDIAQDDRSSEKLKSMGPKLEKKLRELQEHLKAAGETEEAKALEDAFRSLYK